MKKKEIEKIYVCKTNEEDSNIIEKFLVQFVDGNKDYFKLPSFYRKMKPKKQEKQRKLLDKNLRHYTDILAKQNHSDVDYEANSKVVMISNKDKELEEYVDYQIELIKHRNSINTEKSQIGVGLFSFFSSVFAVASRGELGVWGILNTILSIQNFYFATKNNKRRTDLNIENYALKKLKLYFSYLMLSLNIGLNLTNLSVNFEKIQYKITLMNTMDKHFSILTDLDNPFSDANNQLLVTTSDATANLLMEAFKLNPLLDDKDLEIALSMESYIEDNPYLNYEKLYEIFSSFGVVHTNYDNNDVAGDCMTDLGIIDIYDYDNAVQDPYYITTLQHEIIHFTGHLDNTVLNEGMTALLQAEYFNNGNISAYHNHVILTKIFCELISPDKMLEAYSTKDMSIIKEEMLRINSNESDYNSLMSALQEYGTKYREAVHNSEERPDVDRDKLYLLLLPYLESDKLSETTQTEILHYIGILDSRKVYSSKFYFNVNDNDTAIQYLDSNGNLFQKEVGTEETNEVIKK